jgi:hypothetical protein
MNKNVYHRLLVNKNIINKEIIKREKYINQLIDYKSKFNSEITMVVHFN